MKCNKQRDKLYNHDKLYSHVTPTKQFILHATLNSHEKLISLNPKYIKKSYSCSVVEISFTANFKYTQYKLELGTQQAGNFIVSFVKLKLKIKTAKYPTPNALRTIYYQLRFKFCIVLSEILLLMSNGKSIRILNCNSRSICKTT